MKKDVLEEVPGVGEPFFQGAPVGVGEACGAVLVFGSWLLAALHLFFRREVEAGRAYFVSGRPVRPGVVSCP